MKKHTGRESMIESLESRTFLSSVPLTVAPAPQEARAAIVAKAATQAQAGTITTVQAQAGLLGQAVTFTATVRAAASAGSPTGQVEFTQRGRVIGEATLSPATSTSSRFAESTATFTFPAGGGSYDYYVGRNAVGAVYVPDAAFRASRGSAGFFVKSPTYTRQGRLKLATVVPGTGAAIANGQTASVLYTGHLLSDGTIFDWSAKNGGTPLTYTVGNGDVVAGFDQGTVGMTVGETRVLIIPPGLGYGQSAQGSIPAGATLVFVLTLTAIS